MDKSLMPMLSPPVERTIEVLSTRLADVSAIEPMGLAELVECQRSCEELPMRSRVPCLKGCQQNEMSLVTGGGSDHG